MYALYVKNKPLSDRLLLEAGNFFQQKQAELKDKMDLASYLLKPVQRLSKYALFLDGISKTMKPVEREDLQRAQNLIEFQVKFVMHFCGSIPNDPFSTCCHFNAGNLYSLTQDTIPTDIIYYYI